MRTCHLPLFALPRRVPSAGKAFSTPHRLLKLPFAGGLLARACGSALMLLVTALAQGQDLPGVATTLDGHRYRAGEVLVQFKGDVTDQQVAGAFQQGRLGLIKHIQTAVPVAVAAPPAWAGKKAIAIAAGLYHRLGALDDGSVWAWGINWYGQLGDGAKDAAEPKGLVQRVGNNERNRNNVKS